MTEPTAYLRGRIAQVFDLPCGSSPRWTRTDAHAVRELLDEFTKMKRCDRLTVRLRTQSADLEAARRGEAAQATRSAEAS